MISGSRSPELTPRPKDPFEKRRNAVQGVEILYGDNSNQEIEYDIVAVPGLGTNPLTCWEWPSKKPSGRDNEGRIVEGAGFNWLTNPNGLHARQPHARIMLYNYASAYRKDFKASHTMTDLAKALLVGLSENRRAEVTRKRPIVFIGHSMGGTVIAKALCLADAKPQEYPDIIPYVTGCAFFGTPFQGTELAKLAIYYSDAVNYFADEESYTKLLKFMTPGNDELCTLTWDFKSLANRMRPETELFCFYESWNLNWVEESQKGTDATLLSTVTEGVQRLLQRRSAVFVTERSAVLDANSSQGLDASHRDLIRFRGAHDLRFNTVMGHLNNIASKAVSIVRSRFKERALDDLQIASIRALLNSGVNMRVKLDNSPEVSKTDTWLVEESTFDDWRLQSEQSRGCLWIHGRPGYGKTAASIAATHFIQRMITDERQSQYPRKHVTLLACFFCDAQPYCSTAEDLLKSILLQLIGQYPKLAVYAENFLNRDKNSITESRERPGFVGRSNTSASHGSKSYEQTKATMTIEHLWQCLMDALKDISLHAVYIIINNIHRLNRDESLNKLLERIKSDVTCSQDGQLRTQQGRWFFTSSSNGREDIRDCMRHGRIQSNVQSIDLEATHWAANVQMALTHHVRSKVHNLSKTRGYDRSLAFEIEKIVDSKAENKKWVDIIFLQLEALPENCSRLMIKDRLDAAARGDLRKLVEDAWQWIFVDMKDEVKCRVKDVLRALVLLVEDVTLEELAVLTGYSQEDLRSIVGACAPLLLIQGVGQRITFVDDLIKDFLLSAWDTLLTSSVSNASSKEVERQIIWQHGYLTWKCFMHLDKALSSDENPVTDERLSRMATLAHRTEGQRSLQRTFTSQLAQDAKGGNEHDHGNAPISPLAYPIKFWHRHAVAGGQHMAQSLCIDMSDFWEGKSYLRQKWLEHYSELQSDFVDLDINGMTALHVASALGLSCLVSSLLETDRKRDLNELDANAYTPLHLAAFNNHLDVVKTLLQNGAQIEESELVASPLHLAAVRGHVNIMQELLRSKSKSIANVNARCDEYGSVINATILSGVGEAVKELLKREELCLNIDKFESPLVIAARIKPSLFQELLQVGRTIWEATHYEDAMIEAGRSGRVECVNALMKCGYHFPRDCLKTSILKAGVADNWEVVTILLEHPNFGRDLADYYDIFFLAAATKFERDELLERIKKLAKDPIPQQIADAALYHATDNQKTTTVKWLLEQCDANPNATSDRPAELHEDCFSRDADNYGDALTAAVFDNSLDIARTLLKNKAQVDNKHGAALQTAAKQGYLEMIDLLLESRADINRVLDTTLMSELGMNEYSGTALQVACDFNQPAAVKRLLERGANPNLSHPKSKFTCPIISAAQNKRSEILKYLLEVESIKVNVQGGVKHDFPLHSACEDMDLACVEQLFARGADIDVIDAKGNQPIHMAASHGNTEVLKFLLARNANVTHYSQEKGLALQEALKQERLDCGRLLANAITPIFESLVTAAARNNKFAKSIIDNPRAEHPHIDTEEYDRLVEENASLKQRNNSIESILKDYEAMGRRVEEYKHIAKQKDSIAQAAQAELEDTHKRYDCSIEGYDAVNRHRNSLLRQLDDIQAEEARKQNAERARLEHEVAYLRQQLRIVSETLDEQRKKSTNELQVLQYVVQREKLHSDELEVQVGNLMDDNRVLRAKEKQSAGPYAYYDPDSIGSSIGRMSETEYEVHTPSRFSLSDESDRQCSITTGSSFSETDQAEHITGIKRKKVRAPLAKMAGDVKKDRWRLMADATQNGVASLSLSTKATMEDMAEKAKALHKRGAVRSP